MWLVLCSSSDPSGLWIYQGLKQLGVAPLELVLAEWLAYGAQWEHRLDGTSTHLKIVLPDDFDPARAAGLAQRGGGCDRFPRYHFGRPYRRAYPSPTHHLAPLRRPRAPRQGPRVADNGRGYAASPGAG